MDNMVVALFQWVYNLLWDRIGTCVGTFRMSVALIPIAVDTLVRLLQMSPMLFVFANMFILIGISLFYTFEMMARDDRLQMRHNLQPINVRSFQFRDRFFYIRIFYLAFLTTAAITSHHIGALGLLAIVYARCIVVRERITPEARQTFSFKSA